MKTIYCWFSLQEGVAIFKAATKEKMDQNLERTYQEWAGRKIVLRLRETYLDSLRERGYKPAKLIIEDIKDETNEAG